MPKRRLILLGLVAVLGTGTFVSVLAMMPRPRFSREDFNRIKEGMTLDEVEAVLGLPPGDYASGPLIDCDHQKLLESWGHERALDCAKYSATWTKGWLLDDNHYQRHGDTKIKGWVCDTGMFWIRLDDLGKVERLGEFVPHRRSFMRYPWHLFARWVDRTQDTWDRPPLRLPEALAEAMALP